MRLARLDTVHDAALKLGSAADVDAAKQQRFLYGGAFLHPDLRREDRTLDRGAGIQTWGELHLSARCFGNACALVFVIGSHRQEAHRDHKFSQQSRLTTSWTHDRGEGFLCTASDWHCREGG